jgi:hypothetical protein
MVRGAALAVMAIVLGVSAASCGDFGGECCKTCSKGKACGDSCIARDKSCNVGPGCACDA